MEILELMNSHPKSSTVIKQWFLKRALDAIESDDVPEEFKEYIRQQYINNDSVSKVISNSPRALFDIFDNHKIYIETTVDSAGGFWWKIAETQSTVGYEFRINCDKAAIIEAFKLLEAKL